jgi:hypothetical protein
MKNQLFLYEDRVAPLKYMVEAVDLAKVGGPSLQSYQIGENFEAECVQSVCDFLHLLQYF